MALAKSHRRVAGSHGRRFSAIFGRENRRHHDFDLINEYAQQDEIGGCVSRDTGACANAALLRATWISVASSGIAPQN